MGNDEVHMSKRHEGRDEERDKERNVNPRRAHVRGVRLAIKQEFRAAEQTFWAKTDVVRIMI